MYHLYHPYYTYRHINKHTSIQIYTLHKLYTAISHTMHIKESEVNMLAIVHIVYKINNLFV